jgi:nitrate/nitrite transport system substrate-binding protein
MTTGELWFRHPEKILGMRADWVDANPKATLAILMAVMEAQQWCREDGEQVRSWPTIVGKSAVVQRSRSATSSSRIKGDINYGLGREGARLEPQDEVLG